MVDKLIYKLSCNSSVGDKSYDIFLNGDLILSSEWDKKVFHECDFSGVFRNERFYCRQKGVFWRKRNELFLNDKMIAVFKGGACYFENTFIVYKEKKFFSENFAFASVDFDKSDSLLECYFNEKYSKYEFYVLVYMLLMEYKDNAFMYGVSS